MWYYSKLAADENIIESVWTPQVILLTTGDSVLCEVSDYSDEKCLFVAFPMKVVESMTLGADGETILKEKKLAKFLAGTDNFIFPIPSDKVISAGDMTTEVYDIYRKLADDWENEIASAGEEAEPNEPLPENVVSFPGSDKIH